MDFNTAVEIVVDQEGVLTLDPDDSGNWTSGKIGFGQLKGTKYGISAAAYPNEDIRNLTPGRARFLYKRDYWDEVRADEIPGEIRLHVFDFAVNAGTDTAIKVLQKLGRKKQDGVIGPMTLLGAQKVSVWDYDRGRRKHYSDTIKRHPVKLKYLEGWMSRTTDITEISVKEVIMEIRKNSLTA